MIQQILCDICDVCVCDDHFLWCSLIFAVNFTSEIMKTEKCDKFGWLPS